MIDYKYYKARDLSGEHKAKIKEVTAVENQYFDAERENSTTHQLEILFAIEDPNSSVAIEHLQKFISPVAGINGVYNQLLDILGEMPDLDGGQFDEQKFVGMEVIIGIENKPSKDGTKQYANVAYVNPLSMGKAPVKEPSEPVEEKDDTPTDLPFDKKS